jgi:hypothetical protein
LDNGLIILMRPRDYTHLAVRGKKKVIKPIAVATQPEVFYGQLLGLVFNQTNYAPITEIVKLPSAGRVEAAIDYIETKRKMWRGQKGCRPLRWLVAVGGNIQVRRIHPTLFAAKLSRAGCLPV